MEIKDSGDRTQFASGAMRDMSKGKGFFTYGDLGIIGMFFAGYQNDKTITMLADYVNTKNEGFLLEIFNNFVKKFYSGDVSTALMNLAVHYENGANKYEPKNWMKGIPDDSFINSAIRHYLKIIRGDEDEDHKSAFLFNLFGLLWNEKKIRK